MLQKIQILIGCLLCPLLLSAQVLKPGFDNSEYKEALKILELVHLPVEDWEGKHKLPSPDQFDFIDRAPSVAFDNLWDFWMHKEKPVGLISIRGSIQSEASFLANLYAAMIPAIGEIKLDSETTFKYKLADNPNAAVQVGWFVAMAYLSKSIRSKIDSCYQKGIRDFIITGHSQGGGIAYLLTSYLTHLKLDHQLPADIRFKTYCSAGPKPGNLFFAYDYEHITAGGWAFNVVNTADWVPDVPFSVQTVDDFTEINPFRHASAMIKKQKFPKNIALRHVYKQLDKPSRKAQKEYEKYLGKMVSRAVRKQLPGFQTPEYFKSNYYVRTGTTVVLFADQDYFKLYSNEKEDTEIWKHHFLGPYLYLAEKLPL